MCFGLEAIGIIGSLVGTAMSAVGQIQQANAAAAAATYNAQVQSNNAIIANRNAEDSRKRGAAAEEQQRQKTQQLLSRQRAAMAANGVDITSGSPLDILADTGQLGELDALTVRNNYEREAIGYLSNEMNFKAESALSEHRARTSRTAGTIGAIGTLAGGFGSVADRFYTMTRRV